MLDVIVSTLLLHSMLLLAQPRAACEDVTSCRAAALEAAQRKDYEVFHDLAWRAMQKGPRNDSGLMLMLARAQSLSGRPGDSLVMLRRLAEMGIATDAATDADFTRVRALPGWAAVESLMTSATEKPAGTVEPPQNVRTSAAADPAGRRAPSAVTKPPTVEAPLEARADAAPAPASAAAGGEETLRLTTAGIEAIGLAYDSVSRRFVVGDRHRNRLIVADEVFKRVNDLIGAGSGGFGTLTAVEIDRRRGDLWVTSSGVSGRASLHKLQLVSGRLLSTIEAPADLGAMVLGDISIADNGTLLLVDTAGARLVRVSPAARAFDRPVRLAISSPTSITAAGNTTYIAHESGLTAVDAGNGAASEVRAAKGVSLAGLRRIRWHRGSIVAVQNAGDGRSTRLVRIRLAASGRTAAKLEVLDDQTPEDGSALTIANGDAYYLAHAEGGPVIRRVPLR